MVQSLGSEKSCSSVAKICYEDSNLPARAQQTDMKTDRAISHTEKEFHTQKLMD